MPYRRMLNRNNLLTGGYEQSSLLGDLRRMEKDYLDPEYPEAPWGTRGENTDPCEELARATGVPVESVRAILRVMFQEHD